VNYVVAAYLITITLIGGYILSVVLRLRAAEREIEALTAPDPVRSPQTPPEPELGSAGGKDA